MQHFWRIFIPFLLVVLLAVFAAFYVIPAFRGEIVVKPDIYFGPVRLHLYGLVLAGAILAAWFVAQRIAPRFGLAPKQVDEILIWVTVSGFLGARLYFVAFFWEYFSKNPEDILAVWKGGLAIYGALAGGAIGVFLYAKKSGTSFLNLLDLAAVAAPLSQAIGRWGNFFNSEAFGRPTDLPWGLYIKAQSRPAEFLGSQFFHPTFLYESIWDLIVFFILIRLVTTPTPKAGVLTGYYLILYALGRFFIESIRLDSFFINGLRVDQITSLIVMVIGAGILYAKTN